MIFPMMGVGKTQVNNKIGRADESSSNIVQPGVYAMYAFDAGHWLYANPKMTHTLSKPNGFGAKDKYDANTWEVELGGGYMINDWSSAEFKIEHKFANNTSINGVKGKDDTTAWIKYAIYW